MGEQEKNYPIYISSDQTMNSPARQHGSTLSPEMPVYIFVKIIIIIIIIINIDPSGRTSDGWIDFLEG